MPDEYNYKILKYLDAPNKTLFWTHDEILIFILPCFFGLYLSNIMIGMVFGVVLKVCLKRLRDKFGVGAIAIAQYWYLYQLNSLKVTPPSYVREFIG